MASTKRKYIKIEPQFFELMKQYLSFEEQIYNNNLHVSLYGKSVSIWHFEIMTNIPHLRSLVSNLVFYSKLINYSKYDIGIFSFYWYIDLNELFFLISSAWSIVLYSTENYTYTSNTMISNDLSCYFCYTYFFKEAIIYKGDYYILLSSNC